VSELLTSLIGLGSSLFKGSSPSPGDRAVSLAKGAMNAQRQTGINALELIRGGAGMSTWDNAPRIGSSAMFQNSFDQISDILTGRQAREDARDEVEDELRRIALDRAKAQQTADAGDYARRASGYRPPRVGERLVQTDQGPRVMSEIADPTPITASGDIDTTIDDGGTGATLKPREHVVTSGGRTVNLTVGPDLDELVTGSAIEGYDQFREHGLLGISASSLRSPSLEQVFWGRDGKPQRGDPAAIDTQPPLQWFPEFGRSKPDNWDQMTNREKLAFIRKNKQ
jgi:hypothetical protein